MKKSSGWTKFFVGAAIGAGLALLFAPRSGKETREMLWEKMVYLKKKLDEIEPEDVRDKAVQIMDDIKKTLSELDGERVKEIIQEKSLYVIAKADELITLAKEKGTPVFQKSAYDIKDKTSVVLKDMASKLDESNKKSKLSKKVATKKVAKKVTKNARKA
ncbi:MAG: YtxH domain-containing protein [Bacilli bacterium]|nr:YtxH domain-containing protein [Bacilli bacterium]